MKRIIAFFTLSLSLAAYNICFAQSKKIDSLLNALRIEKQDTTRYTILMQLGDFFKNNNPDTSIYYYNQALTIAEKLKDDMRKGWTLNGLAWESIMLGKIKAAEMILRQSLTIVDGSSGNNALKLKAATLNFLGAVKLSESDYLHALGYYFKALNLDSIFGDRNGQAGDFGDIGNVYFSESNYPQALESFLKALKITEETGDRQKQALLFGNIGLIYSYENNFPQALNYYFKAVKIEEELRQKYGLQGTLSNIGVVYSEKKDYSNALKYYLEAMKLLNETGNKDAQAINLNNIGDVYYYEGSYSKALNYYCESKKLAKELENKDLQAMNIGDIGILYIKTGKFRDAENYLKQAISMDSSIGSQNNLRGFEEYLSQLYDTTHRYQLALEWFKKASILKDTLFNIDKDKAITRKELTFTFERQQDSAKAAQDKIDAVHDEVVKKQKVAIFSVSGGLLLVLLLAITIFRSLQQNRKKTEMISAQKTEVEKKNKVIEEKNKDILDSITYAKRLQDAILPPISQIKQYFPESFVFYKPKDIVAGDFYWMEKVDDVLLLAACDCTGHGVPGAMVSVVCSNALNRSVKEFKIRDTGKLLDKVRELVLETFDAAGDVKDGMDCSLCAINTKTGEVEWSGAFNPLWYLQKGEFKEITADKQPIGVSDNPKPFTTHKLNLQKGDSLFLFTDGYADQFGGTKGKKFKYKQLEELILAHADKPMEEQKSILAQEFDKWKGGHEQVDDILVIGLKI